MKQVCAKTLLVGAVCAAMVFAGINPACALEAKVSGQINQMVMYADDGDQSDVFITDNDASSTRVRITGSEQFGQVKVGMQFEIEAQRNASNRVTIDQDNDGAFEWNDRWFNVYFDTRFGMFEIGKGDTATNGTLEVDLSGTSVVTYSDINTTGGSLLWKNDDGTLFGGGVDIGDTRSNFDGILSRAERVRYNTPSFAGLTLSASAANGGAYDAALWYATEFGGNKLAAALGYANPQGQADTVDAQWGGSVSWLMPFGLNFTVAYGQRDFEASGRDEAVSYYAKLGYMFDIHAFSIEYGETKDLFAEGVDASNYGAAYVVKPWKPIELYAAYRIYMADVDGVGDPEDIHVAVAGTRIKF
ncbi:porin [Desulfatitalea tepidiphila]|uniref:porin n=1 Tax=Desulfatitalea tepidiphila TaxID=1185843 RepID=UPI0006B492A5|nr:porin [Desulfatitalea tepidiphila]